MTPLRAFHSATNDRSAATAVWRRQARPTHLHIVQIQYRIPDQLSRTMIRHLSSSLRNVEPGSHILHLFLLGMESIRVGGVISSSRSIRWCVFCGLVLESVLVVPLLDLLHRRPCPSKWAGRQADRTRSRCMCKGGHLPSIKMISFLPPPCAFLAKR